MKEVQNELNNNNQNENADIDQNLNNNQLNNNVNPQINVEQVQNQPVEKAEEEKEKENNLGAKAQNLQNQLNQIHAEQQNKNDEKAPEEKAPENDKASLEQQVKMMQAQMAQMQQTIQTQQAMLAAQQGQAMQQYQQMQNGQGNQMQQQNAQRQFQQPRPQVRQQPAQMKGVNYVNLNPTSKEEAYRHRVKNADEIKSKLQADTLKFEETARKAKKGKYDKKMTPHGMKPKYYYAAVRDYHKDLMKKIDSLSTPELKQKYYEKYYNQQTMDRYVRARANNPVYKQMVDKYSSKKVLDAYEKFNKIRKNPPEFGFPTDTEMAKGVIPAGEHIQIATNSFVYQDNGYGADTAWEQFRKETLEYNKLINERHAKGDDGATTEQIKEKAEALMEKAQEVEEAYGGDWRGRGDDFVKEAKNVKEYLNDVEEYGPYAANLRRTMREKIESAKDLNGGYENQMEAADLMVSKKFLAKNAYSKQFWDQFKEQEGGPDPKETYEKAVKQIDGFRKQVLGDPAFNVCLSQNYNMKDFEKTYNTMVRNRNIQEGKYQQNEAKRRASAGDEFKKRQAKQKAKEEKELKSQQDKIRKLKGLGK